MANESELKPAGELTGAGWRILFLRRDDRIAHRIELATGRSTLGGLAKGDVFEPLVESIEGSADDPWPPSPALQQLHFHQQTSGGNAALLVGMAGRSHWSAAIEMASDGRQASFELACRSAGQPVWLGTQYRILAHGPIEIVSGGAQIGRLVVSSHFPWTIEHRILQLPAAPSADRWPQTIIWRYTAVLRA